jgi:DnaD/phage-associated family protein
MARFRQIQTDFWKDSFITELTLEEKAFYLYLLTNTYTTQCGIYTFIIKFAEVEVGLNKEVIQKLLNKFIEYGKINYSEETKEIIIINWVKHNFVNNKPVINCMNKELQKVKYRPFVQGLYEICKNNRQPVEQIFKDIELAHLWPIGPGIKQKLGRGEEEEIEKEIEIEEYMEETAADGLKPNEGLKKVLESFNNNIHPVTPIEYEKISDWCSDVECGVVILAIEEAVKHNARNFVYIERILNCWLDLGYRTEAGVKAYQRDFKKERNMSIKEK